jgi:hypothetical protein
LQYASIPAGPVTLLPGKSYANVILSFDNVPQMAGMRVTYVVNLVHIDNSSGVSVSTMGTEVILEAPGMP